MSKSENVPVMPSGIPTVPTSGTGVRPDIKITGLDNGVFTIPICQMYSHYLTGIRYVIMVFYVVP
ncbi:MAG: hypothetical protein WAZ77_12010 [Candidatus Nitrosopolaris sp.]